MISQIPEVKQMIECARRFIDDRTNIHELHGYASECKMAAHLFSRSDAISKLADDWMTMSYRYWNEWGDVKEPLTKKEFKKWLKEQIELL